MNRQGFAIVAGLNSCRGTMRTIGKMPKVRFEVKMRLNRRSDLNLIFICTCWPKISWALDMAYSTRFVRL